MACEIISENMKRRMIDFIAKNQGKTLTDEIKKEGAKILDDFVNESCKCYEPISKKIREIINSDNVSEIRQIEQIANSYVMDVCAHLLYEEIKKILELRY